MSDMSDVNVDGRPLPDNVVATIRTVAPMLAGLIVGGLLRLFAAMGMGDVSWVEGLLSTPAVETVLAALYYVAALRLEVRFPSIPWLGSRKTPSYSVARRAA